MYELGTFALWASSGSLRSKASFQTESLYGLRMLWGLGLGAQGSGIRVRWAWGRG